MSLPLVKAAACCHADETISSSVLDGWRFEPLGPTPSRDSRCTFSLSRAWLSIVCLEMFTEFTTLLPAHSYAATPMFELTSAAPMIVVGLSLGAMYLWAAIPLKPLTACLLNGPTIKN